MAYLQVPFDVPEIYLKIVKCEMAAIISLLLRNFGIASEMGRCNGCNESEMVPTNWHGNGMGCPEECINN